VLEIAPYGSLGHRPRDGVRDMIYCLAQSSPRLREGSSSVNTEGSTTISDEPPVASIEAWPGFHRPRMHGRVVFVTGGTRGIGAAICRSFAEQGAVVAAGYGRDRERASGLLHELERHGATAASIRGMSVRPRIAAGR
jgi:short subunit dehydrogenase